MAFLDVLWAPNNVDSVYNLAQRGLIYGWMDGNMTCESTKFQVFTDPTMHRRNKYNKSIRVLVISLVTSLLIFPGASWEINKVDIAQYIPSCLLLFTLLGHYKIESTAMNS